MGMEKIIQQTTAVMINSIADANILRMELKFLRNNDVMIPHRELLNMTRKTRGSKRILEKVSKGESKKDWVIVASLGSVVGNINIPIKLHTIESIYMKVF
jgi:hypothetical protein